MKEKFVAEMTDGFNGDSLKKSVFDTREGAVGWLDRETASHPRRKPFEFLPLSGNVVEVVCFGSNIVFGRITKKEIEGKEVA